MVFQYGGIKEIVFMGTGNKHGFPVGFPVGAVHFKKNYKGDIKYSRIIWGVKNEKRKRRSNRWKEI